MKKKHLLRASLGLAILFTIAACNKNKDTGLATTQPKAAMEEMISEKGANPDEASVTENASLSALGDAAERGGNNGHYLYTEVNGSGKNEIQVYKIKANGSLHLEGSTTSGGNGLGKGLGSQGALAIDKNHEWLFAVNAGSNSVSSFKIRNDGSLHLAHTATVCGEMPVSVTVHGNLLYTLNRGSDNIGGFFIGEEGKLTPIEGSKQALSSTAVDAPQISFTPDGDFVIVTEKATNVIGTFKVKNSGAVAPGVFTASVGATPFGFDFSRGRFMIVTNAAGGAMDAGSVTSYTTGNNGKEKDVNGAVPNGQGAPCWMAVSKFGRFAYASNTGSNSISSYYVSPWGALYLIDKAAGNSGTGPADIVVASNNYYVYALTAKSATINGFSRKFFGGLQSVGDATNIAVSTTGLATY